MTESAAHTPLIKAIITGHTRGLGEALAQQLLSRGIVVLGLSRARNAALAARYAERLDEVELDLADNQSVAAWLKSDTLQRFCAGAELVLLINNAGTVQPIGPTGTQDASAIANAVMLNVATPLMLANAFAATTVQAREQRIVHVSSGAAHNAFAGWSIYGATKAALDQHACATALDNVRGLRICSISPGALDTDMQAEIRDSGAERFPSHAKFEDLKRNGQLGSPERVAAKMIDHLLSDAFGAMPVTDIRSL